MTDMISNSLNHLHPIFSHFPIVLLIASVALDLLALRRPTWRESAWLALLIGTLGALASTVTGLIAHLPYEETPVIAVIEPHQFLAFGTTALFLLLSAWRWLARRRGEQRIGWPYAAVAIVGLGLLTLTGMTGGNLVYNYGVGVEQIVR